MNKQIISMTAVAAMAGAALAVESKNVVGFQNFDGSANFNLTAITFEPIGSETFTLGQIKVNNVFDNNGDYISIWENGFKQYEASYLNAEDAADEGVDEGWYLRKDFNDWEFSAADCKNSEVLAKGKSRSTTSLTITVTTSPFGRTASSSMRHPTLVPRMRPKRASKRAGISAPTSTNGCSRPQTARTASRFLRARASSSIAAQLAPASSSPRLWPSNFVCQLTH